MKEQELIYIQNNMRLNKLKGLILVILSSLLLSWFILYLFNQINGLGLSLFTFLWLGITLYILNN